MRKSGCFCIAAGVTGSGKSEILQTYIWSMITMFYTDKWLSARINRRVGVHLILAIIKSSGENDIQIWSNINLKHCLKVK